MERVETRSFGCTNTLTVAILPCWRWDLAVANVMNARAIPRSGMNPKAIENAAVPNHGREVQPGCPLP